MEILGANAVTRRGSLSACCCVLVTVPRPGYSLLTLGLVVISPTNVPAMGSVQAKMVAHRYTRILPPFHFRVDLTCSVLFLYSLYSIPSPMHLPNSPSFRFTPNHFDARHSLLATLQNRQPPVLLYEYTFYAITQMFFLMSPSKSQSTGRFRVKFGTSLSGSRAGKEVEEEINLNANECWSGSYWG